MAAYPRPAAPVVALPFVRRVLKWVWRALTYSPLLPTKGESYRPLAWPDVLWISLPNYIGVWTLATTRDMFHDVRVDVSWLSLATIPLALYGLVANKGRDVGPSWVLRIGIMLGVASFAAQIYAPNMR